VLSRSDSVDQPPHVFRIIISYDIPETLIYSTTGGRARPFGSSMFLNASSCSEMDVGRFQNDAAVKRSLMTKFSRLKFKPLAKTRMTK
jgi:hypothetical protein